MITVRRPIPLVGIAFVFSTLILYMIAPFTIHRKGSDTFSSSWATNESESPAAQSTTVANTKDQKLHMLLPATRSNVNLCKTLLTMAILGYPSPTIVAWEDQDHADGLLGGGSHFAKITRTLDYLSDPERRQQEGFDEELVLMLDAYDIWFQLPPDVLLSRYRAVVDDDNARVSHRMGKAYANEGIRSQVVFGAGKRCAPNLLTSVSCYPVPDSPLPDDIYGANTDTFIGTSPWSSFRTRYLNSGYIMGPAGEVRRVLERALEKLEECQNRKGASFDDGSGASDMCYHGSDQSIFVEMFGEQEFHREVMRRHHRSRIDDVLDRVVPGRAGATPPLTHVQQVPVRDLLRPAFSHQEVDAAHLPEKPFEFGIALDYWSLLGHQTSNAVTDARYVLHDQPFSRQHKQLGRFDCVPRNDVFPLPRDLPAELPLPWMAGSWPDVWEAMPLYTEICLGTVPVMIHHNSVQKYQRERQWNETWWHGRARMLLGERRKEGAEMLLKGLVTDRGRVIRWEHMCPKAAEGELFRDEKV
ncbi:hypothetical protein J3F83DRAFT_586632 [Trichoderma novae-zelandiae]